MGYSDYVKNTAGSSGGQMLVRVADSDGQGGVISANHAQFFVRSGLSQTFVGSPGFGTSVFYDGVWVGLNNVANYSGSTDWRYVGEVYVSYSQTITFHINASGTSGFGGPDDFAVYVSRGTVPAAPWLEMIAGIGHQGFQPIFHNEGDGGLAIDGWRVGYGHDPVYVQHYQNSTGSTPLSTTYPPGTLLYVWAQGHNAAGWGPFSNRLSFNLLPGIRLKVDGIWKDAIVYVKVAGEWKPAVVYIRKSGIWTLTAQ